MDVCANCFNDKELVGFISSSSKKGRCEICGSADVSLLSIEELFDFFQELIDNFQPSKAGNPLIDTIQNSWNLFSSTHAASSILAFVLPQLKTNILEGGSLVGYTQDIVDNFSHWEILKKDLKYSRRFLSNIEYLTDELAWDSFFNAQFELTAETLLYRGRVHHQSGLPAYQTEEMMCPAPSIARGGRANPSGIPYLYLCDNPETVLYEVRAVYLDELSVGTFCLKDRSSSIRIVDFTEETSLFQPSRITATMKSSLLKAQISHDLSKPMRRYDSEIEYIPTQFICEFIKVITGAGGICFKSSLDTLGKNFVIFDQKLMECDSVILKKVNSLNLEALEF